MEAEHEPRDAFIVAIVRGFIAPVGLMAVLTRILDVQGVWIAFVAAEAVSFMVAYLILQQNRKNNNRLPLHKLFCRKERT